MNSITMVPSLLLLSCSLLRAQTGPGLLDGFETLTGWTVITSEGASLAVAVAPGKTGNALEMDFDLSRVSGYTIVQKEFRPLIFRQTTSSPST